MARLAFFTALGVTTRFTARPGCIARRTPRGTSNLEKKPIATPATVNLPSQKRTASGRTGCVGVARLWMDMRAAHSIVASKLGCWGPADKAGSMFPVRVGLICAARVHFRSSCRVQFGFSGADMVSGSYMVCRASVGL
jgi:hypothetical protein